MSTDKSSSRRRDIADDAHGTESVTAGGTPHGTADEGNGRPSLAKCLLEAESGIEAFIRSLDESRAGVPLDATEPSAMEALLAKMERRYAEAVEQEPTEAGLVRFLRDVAIELETVAAVLLPGGQMSLPEKYAELLRTANFPPGVLEYVFQKRFPTSERSEERH